MRIFLPVVSAGLFFACASETKPAKPGAAAEPAQSAKPTTGTKDKPAAAAPVVNAAPPTAGSIDSKTWQRKDLSSFKDQGNEPVFDGSLELPADAVVAVRLESQSLIPLGEIKIGDHVIELTMFDEPWPANKQLAGVTPMTETAIPGGSLRTWKSDQDVVVWSAVGRFNCEARTKDAEAREIALRVCGSYQVGEK